LPNLEKSSEFIFEYLMKIKDILDGRL